MSHQVPLLRFAVVTLLLAACGSRASTPAPADTAAPDVQSTAEQHAAPTEAAPAGHATEAAPSGHATQAGHATPSASNATAGPVVTPAVTVTPGSTSVPRYGIFELSFNWSSAGYSNPWEQVRVSVDLTSPSGKAYAVGGFYYAPDTWRARFSPSETGTWTWRASIGDGTRSEDSGGSFAVIDSGWPGFVRSNPDNRFRWVFDDGSPYYPIGIGECLSDPDKSGNPFDDLGFDGEFRGPGVPEYGYTADLDTYLEAYAAAGVDLFRWSVDNCAFGLYKTIDPGGNEYLLREGLWGDELVQKLRQNGFRSYMVIFGFFPPFPDGAGNPAQMDAVRRYVKYAVDRYGAYVDYWELMNESPNPPITIADDWYVQVGTYLREVDPYDHPISTSWQRPGLAVIEIESPHWYQSESEFESDVVTWAQIDGLKHQGKPIIFGEQGNNDQNWDEGSALRMRLRSWTAFFAEGTFIFWNSSFAKDYKGGYASNIYLGPEERGYLKVLQDFTRGFDRRAAIVSAGVSDASRVRAYALSGPSGYAAYLHAYTDHRSPTTGIRLTIAPQVGGTALWISPPTGEVLGRQSVTAGSQSLAVPSFVTDLALKIEP